ncbi:MAG: transcription elongation factor GreA [Brevinematales bacterium]|nr:transcription elongation factor GreA [Brevinematales bacterium]
MTDIQKKEDILKSLKERIKEEQWTQTAINEYSVKMFVELDNIIHIAVEEGFQDELKELCNDALASKQNSVIASYILGMLPFEENSVGNNLIPDLIRRFLEHKKYKITEYLCEKLLGYREDQEALRALEMIYESQGNQEELLNIRRRLVLVDAKNAATAKYLGEYYEAQGDKDQAAFYYRLAFERYIKLKTIRTLEELWGKMVKLFHEDINLVLMFARKLREVQGDARVAETVYNDYVHSLMKAGKYEDALKVLKVIVEWRPDDKQIRKALEDCYRAIYQNHSQLEKYLKLSNIGQTWKPYRDAIRIFESHIAFDVGKYVYHKSWGFGQVKAMEDENVLLDFENKPGHKMSLEIALRALTVLDDDHILLWKKKRLDELQRLLQEDPLKVVEIILKSLGGSASATQIKEWLVPDVLSESGWSKWWIVARKRIESSNTIVPSLSRKNVFDLRNSEVSVLDELVSKFKKSGTMETKVKYVIDYKLRGGSFEEASASAMIGYFEDILKSSTETQERKLVAFLVLRFVRGGTVSYDLLDQSWLYGIKNIGEFYTHLDIELKKEFLHLLRQRLKEWPAKYVDLVLKTPIHRFSHFMLEELLAQGEWDAIQEIMEVAFSSYAEKPELYIWFVQRVLEEKEISQRFGLKESEMVFRLLDIYERLGQEIEDKVNVSLNKRLCAMIENLLFERDLLESMMHHIEPSTALSLYAQLDTSTYFPEGYKQKYLEQLLQKYPDLASKEMQEKTKQGAKIRPPLLVTKKSLETKRAELNRLVTVEIPENSRAIGEAMEKGDLRENAEYKAALEKQDQLKAAVARLESELAKAKVIEKSMVDTSIVDVGTKVTLKTEDGKRVTYQILGQWDVDFEKNIISYLSPLGAALLDKQKGDVVEFSFGNERKIYTIESIEMADFSDEGGES